MPLPSEAVPAADYTWKGDHAAGWIRQAAALDRQLAPVSEVLFTAASLAPGEAVLDVGCGTGPTTRQAALAVGANGRVAGLDIAGEMLAVAAATAADDGAAPIEWIEADAVDWDPPTARPYDVVLSRFGVMFFSDPPAAFGALALASRPGGRLAIATWARRDESELFAVPLRAALDVLDRDDTELPDGEGPYSLHDPAGLAALLEGVGWGQVRTEVHRLPFLFVGGMGPLAAADAALDFGPTRVLTAELDDESRSRVVAAIAEAFEGRLDGAGQVTLGGTVLLTTASRTT